MNVISKYLYALENSLATYRDSECPTVGTPETLESQTNKVISDTNNINDLILSKLNSNNDDNFILSHKIPYSSMDLTSETDVYRENITNSK